MSTMTLTQEQPSDVDNDDDLVHHICCNEFEAVCGEELEGIECSINDDDPVCVECEIIMSGVLGWTCPYCGGVAMDGYFDYESE